MDEKLFYTRNEAARILNVSVQSISNLGERGILKLTKTPKNIMVEREDLWKYIDSIRPAAREYLEMERLKEEIHEEYTATVIQHKAILDTKYVLGIFEWDSFVNLIRMLCMVIRCSEPLSDANRNSLLNFLTGNTSELIASNIHKTRQTVYNHFKTATENFCIYLKNFKRLADADKQHLRRIAEQEEQIKMLQEKVRLLSRELGKKVRFRELDKEQRRVAEILATEISDKDFGVRALHTLYSLNVRTFGDLIKHNAKEILFFRNCGAKTLHEIERKMESLGLSFGMEDYSNLYLETLKTKNNNEK